MSGPTAGGMFTQQTFATARTPRVAMGGRHRLGIVAAAATLLAAAPLAALFDGLGWLVHCTATVAAIAGAAAVARTFRAPVWAQLLAMVGGLLIMLTWLFRSGEELLGVLPTPATLAHFGDLLGQLPGEVRNQAVPVPGLDPFLLATALGVGAVAIVVDLCAVGLRRPALAGLPMLAVYSVPVAVLFTSVPAVLFVVGVVGYLWLLGTDNLDRVRRFGRRFTGDGRDVDFWEPSPLAAAGRRLALVGAVIAVIAPLVVPGVTTGLIDRFGPGLAGVGGSGSGGPATAVNLFAALDGLLNRDETVEMLEISTDDPDPHYLRIGVADQITPDGFDHRRPRGAPVTAGVEGPPVRPGVTLHPHRAEVRVLAGYTMPRLPAYPDLRGVEGLDGNWHHDPDQQVVFSPGAEANGLAYTFDYARPEFDPEALRLAPPPLDGDLQQLAGIPPDLHEPRVSALVADLTGELSNPYDQVRAIHGHFSTRNGFTYSLETGDATTGSAIVDFLFENQQGYCVQYAVAMAWMVRELGLPARVAIGFTSGRSRTEGTYTLTNQNAHAWTEVYFEGFGWVPFDPTPRAAVSGSVSPEWAPDPNAPPETDPSDPAGGEPGVTPGLDDPVLEDPGFGEDGGGISGPAEPEPDRARVLWLVLGTSALVLASLAAPAASRAWLRRARLRRRSPPATPAGTTVTGTPVGSPGVVTSSADPARRHAHATWDELLDTMTDFGVPLDPAESPRVTAARLVKQYRLDGRTRLRAAPSRTTAEAEAARLLGHAEERARYARTPLSPEGLVPALRTVRQALAGQSTRAARLRAALFPPSTLRRWRRTVGDVATSVAAAANRWGELIGRLSPGRLLRSP